MLNMKQVSNLITFYNENVEDIKKHGTDKELDDFGFYMSSVFECLSVDPYFEEGFLVDLVEF